ncbi:MAG: hypothetical protein V4638_00425 [Bacteroidota bacterium]
MKNQLFISQLIGDVLFPILGFLLWDWSLYFILIFVLLDLLCDLVVTHFKANKIAQFQGAKSKFPFSLSLIAIALFALTLSTIHFLVFTHVPAINFAKELVAFWNYQDMGLPQGYLLLPLLILMSIQQYRLEFSMPAMYRKQVQKEVWKNHFTSYWFLLAFAGIGIGLVTLLQVNETILVCFLLLVLILRTVSTRFLQPAR